MEPRTEVPAAEPVAETPTDATMESDTATGKTGRNRRSRDRRPRRESLRADKAETGPAVQEPEPEVIAPPRRFVDRTVGAHLIERDGLPQIVINNVSYPPVLFFGNIESPRHELRVVSEVRRAARAGVHLHSTLVELPCPLSEATEALDAIDRTLRAILDADPDGFVMPRIVFVPARGWRREYPTDIATFADGPTADPSLTSERFWREAEHSAATLVRHLREYEWSSRIFGYHLERGEWFQPADRGYDRSMANREAFRDWLREKYKNSLVGLRAAWYDGDVQFHTAEIPAVHAKPAPNRAFFESRRERPIIDFFEFTSDSTARRLMSLAVAFKQAADDQALVSVCYGYTLEFGHGFNGHLALGKLLECPDIDLLCGPPSYRDRKPGGAASFPAPVDSPRLHGKLWLSEDDTKTFLAPVQQDPDDFNPRLSDRYQTEQAHARSMGRAYSTRTGIGFMDLWGEGWLDDDEMWTQIGAFAGRYASLLSTPDQPRKADVVALIDERSLLHVQQGEAFFRKLTAGVRDVLQRAGVTYQLLLQSDILHPNFPTDARLYLFLTPYRLPTEQRTAIAEKLQKGGKTLAWLFAPGACEERPHIGSGMEESATGTIGLVLRQQEWNSEIGTRIIEPRHPITERLTTKEFGTRERLNPSFSVDDPDAVVLGEYQNTSQPSIAVKRIGDWQSVFVGEPTLTPELLRGICRFAGVHLWTSGTEDVTYIGEGWITLHAVKDGQRALRLPEPAALYDVTERKLVADDLREHRFFMRGGTTRTFCTGSRDWFRRLGIPLQSSEPAGPRPEPQAQPERLEPAAPSVPPAPQPHAPPSAEMSEDMQTLQAVLSIDLSAIGDLPLDDFEGGYPPPREEKPRLTDAAEAEARLAALLPEPETPPPGRKRRRRGGRGRGRRRTANGELIPGTESAAPGTETPGTDQTPQPAGAERTTPLDVEEEDDDLADDDDDEFDDLAYTGAGELNQDEPI